MSQKKLNELRLAYPDHDVQWDGKQLVFTLKTAK